LAEAILKQFSVAVRAVNDTAGPEGLMPALLVFGTYPTVADHNRKSQRGQESHDRDSSIEGTSADQRSSRNPLWLPWHFPWIHITWHAENSASPLSPFHRLFPDLLSSLVSVFSEGFNQYPSESLPRQVR
jgi:hypothetical protein